LFIQQSSVSEVARKPLILNDFGALALKFGSAICNQYVADCDGGPNQVSDALALTALRPCGLLLPKNSDQREERMFVCPDCKKPLEGLRCQTCRREFEQADGIPILISHETRYESARNIGKVYDDVYKNHTKVWEDQGRTPEFLSYFADLVAHFSTGSLLEIGCGEGFLLSALRGSRLAAIDLSSEALRSARQRVAADFCVAIAERLPFSENTLDLVLAVGVMEHFIDDGEATREILRVLKPGGRYLTLIHVDMSVGERINQKIKEYFFPRPRPVAFFQYVAKKVIRPISQPVQRLYKRQTARKCLEESGFVVDEIISSVTHPRAPFIGPHVLLFVARKP
jgi:SAM-dependent methyltransferase